MRTTTMDMPGDGGAGLALLDDCQSLLNFEAQDLGRARALLTLLGDDLRRTIVERLTTAPRSDIQDFANLTASTPADVSHRLRSLRRAGVVIRDRHRGHRVRPEAMKVISSYFDLLQLASARTLSAQP